MVETAHKGVSWKEKTTARGVGRVRRRKNVFCHSSPFPPTVFILPLRLTFTPFALSERLEQAMLTRVPWWFRIWSTLYSKSLWTIIRLCHIAFTLTRPPLLETGSFQWMSELFVSCGAPGITCWDVRLLVTVYHLRRQLRITLFLRLCFVQAHDPTNKQQNRQEHKAKIKLWRYLPVAIVAKLLSLLSRKSGQYRTKSRN